MLNFNWKYFTLTVVLFVIEVLIAVFIDDQFIRPHVGDFLVVILIYCFLKTFLKISFWYVALFVFVFALTVETLQYFQIVVRLGWGNNQFARTVIGTSFSWKDIVSYAVGTAVIIIFEWVNTKGIKVEPKV
mgnify:CR=1 FL=1